MLNQLLIISVFLFAVLSFALGIFSISRNPKSFTVQLWFLMSVAVGLWSFSLLLLLLNQTEQQGILYSKLLHVGASFTPILFCHFVLSFLYQLQKKKFFLLVGYILATGFALLSLTKAIILGVEPNAGFPFWVKVGSLYPLLLIYFWFYALAAIYFLYRGYRKSDGIIRRKTFYILIAAIIGFGGGGTSFLPQTLGVYPYGDLIAWLYPILITYGIFVDEFKIKIKF